MLRKFSTHFPDLQGPTAFVLFITVLLSFAATYIQTTYLISPRPNATHVHNPCGFATYHGHRIEFCADCNASRTITETGRPLSEWSTKSMYELFTMAKTQGGADPDAEEENDWLPIAYARSSLP